MPVGVLVGPAWLTATPGLVVVRVGVASAQIQAAGQSVSTVHVVAFGEQ